MISFETLWDKYPAKESIKVQCINKQVNSSKPFEDYCAIMLSECFMRANVDISLFGGNKCWSHTGKKHILLAEDLAHGLKKHAPAGFGKLEKIIPGSFQSKLDGRTGVVFFKDYWQRGSESFGDRSGDHIDLWNKNKISNSSMFARSILEFLGRVSDLNKSREIWFWAVK